MHQRMMLWVAGLLLGVYALLCLLAYPVADDFTIPVHLAQGNLDRQGLFTHFRSFWSGRYTSHLFSILLPYEWLGLYGYQAVLLLSLGALYLALYHLFSHFFVPALPPLQRHLAAAWMLLLYLHVIPGPEETIYWWSGAAGYTWALVFHCWWLIAWLRHAAAATPRWKHTLGLAALTLVVAGFTEISLALTLALGLLLVVVPAVRRKTFDAHHLLLAGSGLLAALAVLLAPGNALRMELFPHSQSLWISLRIATASLLKLNGILLQSVSVLLTAVLLLPWLQPARLAAPLARITRRHPLLLAGLWQMLLLAAFLVPAWAMGINPPMRVYNYIALFWLTGFLLWLFSINHHLAARTMALWPPFRGKGLQVFAAIILLTLLLDFTKPPGQPPVFRGNTPAAIHDLTTKALPYHHEIRQREHHIRQQQAAGADTLRLPPLQHRPKLVFYLDLTPDPNHWINLMKAWYLQVDAVVLEEGE
jgi:hypothetical protein